MKRNGKYWSQTKRQQAQANKRIFLTLDLSHSVSNSGFGSLHVSHSSSVMAYSFPKIRSTTQHPRTCGPSLRQCFSTSSLSQPAS